jgi:hypothetical protein
MLRISSFLVLLLCLPSCMTIGFEQPQPAGKKSQSTFPKALLGVYDEVPFGRDTELIILPQSIYIDGEDDVLKGQIHLSDSLVLKKFSGFYFASYRDKDNACWIVHPFKGRKGELWVYNLDLDKEQAAAELSAYTPITRQATDLLVIDPNRRTLRKMLKDPDLWQIDTLYRWE